MSDHEEDPGKPKVPPPSLSKGPAEPPPPSLMGETSSSPPPPSPTPAPGTPAAPTGGVALPKVRVKPGSGDDEDEEEKTMEPVVPLGTRVGGFLIDLAISLGLFVAVTFVLPDMLDRFAGPLALLYLVFRDGLPFLNGQSVGKAAMKTKAVTLDGESLSGNWQPALVRNVALILFPIFPLVELIVLLTREDKPEQGIRLGDEWAKTKVIPVAVRGGAAEDEAEEETPDQEEDEES